MEYCKNEYGIPVKKWCVTCQKKDGYKRIAMHMGMGDNCWVMKDAYQNAGKGDGRVRRLMSVDTPTGKILKFVDIRPSEQ